MIGGGYYNKREWKRWLGRGREVYLVVAIRGLDVFYDASGVHRVVFVEMKRSSFFWVNSLISYHRLGAVFWMCNYCAIGWCCIEFYAAMKEMN